MRIENRHRPPVGGDGEAGFLGGRLEADLFRQLRVDHIGERRHQTFQLAIDTAQADPRLHPQDVGGEEAEHDEQRQRVPEREPRAEGAACS